MGAGAVSGIQASDAVRKILIQEPKVKAPLDPNFAPVILAKRAYNEAAKDCADS